LAVKPNNRQGEDKDGGVVHNAAVFSIEATGFNFLRTSHLESIRLLQSPARQQLHEEGERLDVRHRVTPFSWPFLLSRTNFRVAVRSKTELWIVL